MSASAALALRGVSKRFGGVEALSGVDVVVERGEIRALIGPNGAGKTTVVNIAAGVYRPDSGTVHLDGDDITRLPTHRRARRGLGRTYQAARLFDQLTVAANVRIMMEAGGVSVDAAAAERVLDSTGLTEHADVRANDLPHGRRKMLEVACAIHRRPAVLLLDEPAAGLGEAEITAFVELLRQREADVGVLIIDHNMELIAQLCDTVTVINVGRPLAEGTPREVFNDEAVISAYLGGTD